MSGAAAPPVTDGVLSTPPPSSDELLRLAQAVARNIHSADLPSWCAVDLTMPQLKALFLARSDTGASHGDIARALGVTLSTVTGIVDRLVEHGLVERRTDPTDRRLSRVVATQAGNDLIDRLWASRHESLARILERLSPADRAALHRALLHVAGVIGAAA